MASVASIPFLNADFDMTHEHAYCGGCHDSVDDGGGVVVAFGNSLWHVDCFKCAKCGDRVNADTNLLLLSDGSPVCSSCSYNCAVCKKPISHEAIMTGHESYHAACFTCKTCGRHIGELVFAKTTQGIYCMACHNERVARSRRHKHRNKAHTDGTRDKDRDRLHEKHSISQLRENDNTTFDTPPTTPGLHNPQITSANSAVSHAAKRISTASIPAALQIPRHQSNTQQANAPSRLQPIDSPATIRPSSPLPSPKITTTFASPLPSSSSHSSHHVPQASRADTLPLLQSHDTPGPRRKSFDDGVRPLEFLSPTATTPVDHPSSGAGPTSRADKRSSVNPATRLEWIANSQILLSPTESPTVEDSKAPRSRSRSQDRSRSSHKRSVSGSSHSQGQKWESPRTRSPISDASNTPPTSSPLLATLQARPKMDLTENDFAAARKGSLPDLAWPLFQQQQSHLPESGRVSPSRPLTPGANMNSFASQPLPLPVDHPRAGTPQGNWPNVSLELDEGDTDDESHLQVEPKSEERASMPALPRMSFLGTDTSFQDLLMLGSMSPNVAIPDAVTMEADIPMKHDAGHVDESGTGAPVLDARQPEENKEAGPSKLPKSAGASKPTGTPTVAGTSTSPSSSPPHKTSTSSPRKAVPPALISPLTSLPARNESLSKKPSMRKPVPQAIVLPDTFEADMAYELDESSNATSSPGWTPSRSDTSPGTSSLGRSSQRPDSGGAASNGPPPISPRSPRRSSTSGFFVDGSASTPTRATSNPTVTVTDAGSTRTARPMNGKDTSELVLKRIKEVMSDAQGSGANSVRLDREFLEVIYTAVQAGKEKLRDMSGKFDGMRRASQQYIDGLSVAQEEYDLEVAARRDVEAEVTRLKVQISGLAARLTELSATERKRDVIEQISKDMRTSIHSLERELSKLRVERDLTLVEVEELQANISSGQMEGTLQRSFRERFDLIKSQYRRELEPLALQREALLREIQELKEERNICLEETTALNARNEELAELNAQTSRQIESGANGDMRAWSPMLQHPPSTPIKTTPLPAVPYTSGYTSTGSTLSTSTSTTLQEERDPRATPVDRKKWFKPNKDTVRAMSDGPPIPEKETLRHNFQQLTILRFARCDHCGDKMWGTQLRCNICNIGCHNRCISHISSACIGEPRPREDAAPLQPSMFGRPLIEQVRADSVKEHRDIPIIVEKCIAAVELLAMDYEGIYRKTGGSAQSKAITQLFERGNYDAFDLNNPDTFNDISSVTSVMKTYFRQLPNPLLTHALHEAFVGAASIRDTRGLSSLVYQLPSEHFHTLRYLMLHLHRVQLRSSENLMNARNLGVVFGPTLMRSSDLNREFADMAGKALAIEWLIENAPSVFREDVT
ncbi:RhoGAP-domain-containing protein [Ramaria rubella]|nr:RhoGAP-domain-containing protein [Ramaria rubella]